MTDFATLAIRMTTEGAARVQTDLRQVEQRAGQTEQAAERLTRSLNRLKQLLALGLGIQGLNSLIQMSDKMQSLNAQVRFVTRSTKEYNAVNQRLFHIAQQTRASLEATTTIYTRTARALKDYGYSQQRILTFTETLNKAMVVGGVGAEEQASALFQLSQALGSGRLQGDEFKTIAEAAPIILDTVAQYMGKSRAEVKALAAEGKITSQVLFEAITGATGRIAAQFDTMPLTFGQAMQQMRNAALKFVDDIGNSTGMFTLLAETIAFLAQNFKLLSVVMLGISFGHLLKSMQASIAATKAKTAATAIEIMQTNAAHAATVAKVRGIVTETRETIAATTAIHTQALAELDLARIQQLALAASLKLAQSEATRNTIRNQMKAQAGVISAMYNNEQRIKAQLDAQNKQLTASERQLATAEAALTAGRERLTAATQRLTIAQRAMNLAGRAGGAVMGMLGGPAGMVTLAAAALFYFADQARQARENAVNLEAANNVLATSYENLTAAAMGSKISEHTKRIAEQREEVEKLGSKWINAETFRSSPIKIQQLKDDYDTAKKILDDYINHAQTQHEHLARIMIQGGASYDEVINRLKNYGVAGDELNHIMQKTTDYLQDNGIATQSLQAKLAALGIDINAAQLDFGKLNTTAVELNNLLPSSSEKVKDLSGVFATFSRILGTAINNVDGLKTALNGLSTAQGPQLNDKVKEMIARNDLDKRILQAKTPQEKARLQAQRTVSAYGDLDEFSKKALYDSEYEKHLAQNQTRQGRSGGGGSKTDRYAEMYNGYTTQVAQLQTEGESIAKYGGVSIYKEYDQLMAKLKTDRETFKNMTAAQIAELKKLAAAADEANQAKQVKRYEFDKTAEFEQMQFEAELLNKTAAEQERLNYYRKIDNEIKQIAIGMSDEYVEKLREQGEAAKRHYDDMKQLENQNRQDPIAGMRDGFEKFGKEAGDVMGNVSGITLNALNGMSDALTNLVMTGKADFRSLATSIIKDIIQMTIKMMIFKAASRIFGLSGGGSVGGVPSTPIGAGDNLFNVFSRGGIVGFDSGGFTGYGGKYQPAGIVHKGEYVLTKEATSRLGVDYLDYLNYQSRSKPQGFAHGGGSGLPTVHPSNAATPQVKVNIINHGEAAEAKVESKQTAGGLEITVELIKTMTDIAKREANHAIQTNFRAGGVFA